MNTNTKLYLTPNEAAAMLRISPVTLRAWATKGNLKAKTTPGGHRRYLVTDIEVFARERQIALDSPNRTVSRVLVVDDDPEFSKYLRELLEGPPFNLEVMIASDGFQAGHAIARFQPDVMLLDLRMPGLDGAQVCEQLHTDAAHASLRIIAMTGYKDDPRVARMIAAGAESCLAKPVTTQDLLEVLGMAVSGEQKRLIR